MVSRIAAPAGRLSLAGMPAVALNTRKPLLRYVTGCWPGAAQARVMACWNSLAPMGTGPTGTPPRVTAAAPKAGVSEARNTVETAAPLVTTVVVSASVSPPAAAPTAATPLVTQSQAARADRATRAGSGTAPGAVTAAGCAVAARRGISGRPVRAD